MYCTWIIVTPEYHRISGSKNCTKDIHRYLCRDTLIMTLGPKSSVSTYGSFFALFMMWHVAVQIFYEIFGSWGGSYHFFGNQNSFRSSISRKKLSWNQPYLCFDVGHCNLIICWRDKLHTHSLYIFLLRTKCCTEPRIHASNMQKIIGDAIQMPTGFGIHNTFTKLCSPGIILHH